jgi:hypothetical protein
MRSAINLFWFVAGFAALVCAVYTVWNLLSGDTNGGNGGRVEWIGTVGLALTCIMAAFIAFYLSRSYRSQGGQLPEDRLDASIDDGDPELGFFSPWSWWPIVLASAAGLAFLGLAIGPWIIAFSAGLVLIGLVGWVYEYYRGFFAR